MANFITVEEDDKRLELYKKGLNDKEIGEIVFADVATIQGWRTRRNLPSNVLIGKAIFNKARKELYDYGFTDREIAAISKVSFRAIIAWRKLRNLPANKKKNPA
jgi:hypothetical protein